MTNPTLRFKSADGLDFPDTVSCTLADIAKYAKGTIERKTCLFIGNEQLISNFGGATLEFRTEAKGIEFSNGDILFGNIRPYLKKVWLSDQSGVASPDVLTFKATNSIPGYLKCILSSERFFNHVAQGYKGSKMPRGDKHQIMDFRIQCPCLEEQQKIASFFSTLDQKIELNERKLEALEKLKKGVMQKCFNNSDWTKHQLKDVCKSFSGGTPNSKNRSFYNGKIPFIRSGEIHQNITELSVTTEALKNSSAKLVKKGDLLYALYGANSGDCDLSKINGAINQAILCIRPKSDNTVDMLFLKEQLFHLKSKITSKYLQGGQGNLSGGLVMNLSILLPPYVEQLTYSSLFKSFNNKIEITKQKLLLLRNLKQGLMQQMFV